MCAKPLARLFAMTYQRDRLPQLKSKTKWKIIRLKVLQKDQHLPLKKICEGHLPHQHKVLLGNLKLLSRKTCEGLSPQEQKLLRKEQLLITLDLDWVAEAP